MNKKPVSFRTETELDDFMSKPADALLERAHIFSGTTVVLGIAGKMGITLGTMLKRTLEESGTQGRIVGVSRFSDSRLKTNWKKPELKLLYAI